MRTVFADTFYYLALLLKADPAHANALLVTRSLRSRMATTTWVLTELGNALSDSPNRALFTRLIRGLDENPTVIIVDPTRDQFNEGVRLFCARPDKSWSLTDCISFVVMEQLGIADALTGDRHFEQAGFRALLR